MPNFAIFSAKSETSNIEVDKLPIQNLGIIWRGNYKVFGKGNFSSDNICWYLKFNSTDKIISYKYIGDWDETREELVNKPTLKPLNIGYLNDDNKAIIVTEDTLSYQELTFLTEDHCKVLYQTNKPEVWIGEMRHDKKVEDIILKSNPEVKNIL